LPQWHIATKLNPPFSRGETDPVEVRSALLTVAPEAEGLIQIFCCLDFAWDCSALVQGYKYNVPGRHEVQKAKGLLLPGTGTLLLSTVVLYCSSTTVLVLEYKCTHVLLLYYFCTAAVLQQCSQW
jgi:hypothetical protein